MSKHAYLIMAHHQFDLLARLLTVLDDERNDLYLHVDARSTDVDFDALRAAVKHAHLTFTVQTKVTWGGFSQIATELLLLEAATSKPHDYYHLISGVDLPLRSQDEIHAFFDERQGQEFVYFQEETVVDVDVRARYYHPLQEIAGRPNNSFVDKLALVALRLQQLAKVNRLTHDGVELHYGWNWFSITDDLARYVLSRTEWIEKTFRWSVCGDELFLQTLVWNSPFVDRLAVPATIDDHRACLRLVDFTRGAPYTYRAADFDDLMASDYLFARKFDTAVDSEVVDRVIDVVSTR